MAVAYEGTSLAEFKAMPIDELLIAQQHYQRINKEREAEMKRRGDK